VGATVIDNVFFDKAGFTVCQFEAGLDGIYIENAIETSHPGCR
jgi:hypothetical protein